MDRQIIFAVAIAVGTMLGFSGLFFGQTPRSDEPRPQYAPEDIRHNLQQADAKKKKSKAKKPAKEEFASGTSSSGGGDFSGSEVGRGDNEEPDAEEPEAEEPPIE